MGGRVGVLGVGGARWLEAEGVVQICESWDVDLLRCVGGRWGGEGGDGSRALACCVLPPVFQLAGPSPGPMRVPPQSMPVPPEALHARTLEDNMAWGAKRGVEDLAARIAANDPALTSLIVLPLRKFGANVLRASGRRPDRALSLQTTPRPQYSLMRLARTPCCSNSVHLVTTCPVRAPPCSARPWRAPGWSA